MSTTVSFNYINVQCMCTTRFLPARCPPCHHFHAYTHIYTHTHTHTPLLVFVLTTLTYLVSSILIQRINWLQGKLPDTNAPLPSHLVLFDVLVPVSSSLYKPKCLFVIVYFSVENCFFLSKSHYEEVTDLNVHCY